MDVRSRALALIRSRCVGPLGRHIQIVCLTVSHFGIFMPHPNFVRYCVYMVKRRLLKRVFVRFIFFFWGGEWAHNNSLWRVGGSCPHICPVYCNYWPCACVTSQSHVTTVSWRRSTRRAAAVWGQTSLRRWSQWCRRATVAWDRMADVSNVTTATSDVRPMSWHTSIDSVLVDASVTSR